MAALSTAAQVAQHKPKDLIIFSFGDKTFKCSAYFAAHLLWTNEQLKKMHPGARIHIIQACYHEGVELSAGTHDRDAVVDAEIIGLDWWEAQWFFRLCGFGAWFRHTGSWADKSDWHIHMFDLGYIKYGLVVGNLIPGQRVDYYNHTFGLARQHTSGADHSRFPKNIDATIFDFALWERELEDDMGYSDWSAKDRKALVNDIVEGMMERPIHSADERQFSNAIAATYQNAEAAKDAATEARNAANAALAAVQKLGK